jgi:DNA repair protein RadA/Sms
MLAAETDIGSICDLVEQTKPGIVVIDSIQTMHCAEISSSAGSVSQVKECTARLLTVAKTLEIPTFIVGHVNKDGAIAGPKVMEHIVDTVLYFEGDKMLPYRVLRAAKNRYGSTNEIGMFDMTGTGLKVIENPSKLLLEGRPIGVSGNCVACTMEGTRPILSEIQALVTKTGFGTPRRAASGFDFNRMNLLLAVLEKRAGYFLGNLDVYINIVGGLELDETACDLSVCLAVVSSLMDKPVPDDMIAIGEVGLGGEVRNVTNLEYRLRESQRMGFVRAVVPKHSLAQIDPKEFNTMELLGVTYVKQAIQLL